MKYLSDPGEARDCSTNTVVIHSLSVSVSHPFPQFVYTTKLRGLTQFLKSFVSAAVVKWSGRPAYCAVCIVVELHRENFLLWFEHFPKKIGEDDQNPNILRNFSLPQKGRKKFLEGDGQGHLAFLQQKN